MSIHLHPPVFAGQRTDGSPPANCKTTRRQQSAGSGGARFLWDQHRPHVITKDAGSGGARFLWDQHRPHVITKDAGSGGARFLWEQHRPHVITRDCGTSTVVRERLTSVRRTALAASHARHNRDAWKCRSQPRSGGES